MGVHWECGVNEAQHMVLALYARDAGGLQPFAEPDVPKLEPVVPLRPGLMPDGDRAAATMQWEQWWGQLWTTLEQASSIAGLPDSIPGLNEQRELLTLVQAVFHAALQYCTARKHEIAAFAHSGPPNAAPEVTVLKAATRRRGLRRPHPVKLQVSELPAETAQGWHRSPGDVVVTRPLRRDLVAYQRWLSPIVNELAWSTQQASH